MAKKISAVLVAVMMLVCVFAACGSTSSASVVGSWTGLEDGIECVYNFNADGTGTGEAMDMEMDLTYEIKGNKITITIDTTGTIEDMLGMSIEDLLAQGLVTQADVDELITTETYTFSVKGDTLTMGGNTYTKVN